MKKKKVKQRKKIHRATGNGQRWSLFQRYPVLKAIDWEGLVIFSVVTALFAVGFAFRDLPWHIGMALGMFLAFVALSYFDSKKWKPRPFLNATLGAVLGVFIGLHGEQSLTTVIGLGVAGFFIGYFALKWVPYV